MNSYLKYLKGHSEEVNSLSYSENLLASGSSDGTVRIWDTQTERSIRRLTDPSFFPSGSIENVFMQSTTVLASTSQDLFTFDIRNPSKILIQESLYNFHIPEDINQIYLKNDLVLLPLDDGKLVLLSLSTNDIFSSFEAHENVTSTQICSTSLITHSSLIVSGGFDCHLKLWDLRGSLADDLDLFKVFGSSNINPPHIYQISQNGSDICVGLGNGHLCLFNVKNQIEPLQSWEAHNERIVCCGWSLFSNQIFTASSSDLALWDNGLKHRISLEAKVIFT